MSDFENMVKLSDFCRERQIETSTATVYINRHPEIKKHVHYDNYNKNATYLDEVAVELLSKKYRATTQVITDVDMYNAIMESNKKMQELADKVIRMACDMAKLQQENVELKSKNAELEQKKQLLIEQKEADSRSVNAEIEMLKAENERLQAENQKMIDTNRIVAEKLTGNKIKIMLNLERIKNLLENKGNSL